MDKYIIEGRKKIIGETDIQGSKNSALPILAATVLVPGISVIHNCPDLSDITATINILEHLGCKVKREDHTVIVDSFDVNRYDIPDKLMHEMRSSIVFLGAILGRLGKASLSLPGGCEIGLRPIDIHLDALRRFGVKIVEEFARLECENAELSEGIDITLSFPSVGATENIMLFAATSKGTTTIYNAAREPEISDLADYLNGCGAKIYGAGDGTVVIQGVNTLRAAEHTVIPDRIVAGTYLCAAAMTNGKITLNNIIPAHLGLSVHIFKEAGCDLHIKGRTITLTAPPRLSSVHTIRTMPYPGFPTDMQAPVMAMVSLSRGTSVIIETIFERRFRHVSELLRMGAKIRVDQRMAVVEGVGHLTGAMLNTPDLRGGSALVLAAIAANGYSEIKDIFHIDRGYEGFENTLSLLGADIKRVKDDEGAEYPGVLE